MGDIVRQRSFEQYGQVEYNPAKHQWDAVHPAPCRTAIATRSERNRRRIGEINTMDKEDRVYYEGYGSRPRSLRKHWVNCLGEPDREALDIDRMEDELAEKERERALPIRRLITRFEACHWNSDRWLERIVQAIGEEQVPPASSRPRTEHPLAQMLACLRQTLIHWVTRSTTLVPQCTVLDRSGAQVARLLGPWSAYKAWVVQRVIEGLDHHMCSAGLLEQPEDAPTKRFPGGLTLEGPEADAYFAGSPEMLAQARSQKLQVRREVGGPVQEHSLALVLGLLNPCNKFYFQFLFALFELLDAPGEDRVLPSPFCGNLSQGRHERYYRAINALRHYLGKPPEGSLPADEAVLARLGAPTEVKRWLVASLEKTLREQTPPPPAGGSEWEG
jgi:hypothetical protein